MIIVQCKSGPPRKKNLCVAGLKVAHTWPFDTMTTNEPNNLLKVDITSILFWEVDCSWLSPLSMLSGLSNSTSHTQYPYLVRFSLFTCTEALKARSTSLGVFCRTMLSSLSNSTSHTRYPYLVRFSLFTCTEALKARSTSLGVFCRTKNIKKLYAVLCSSSGENELIVTRP